jgi:4-hydroxybenzoate polyprenyltransferase
MRWVLRCASTIAGLAVTVAAVLTLWLGWLAALPKAWALPVWTPGAAAALRMMSAAEQRARRARNSIRRMASPSNQIRLRGGKE